MAADDSAPLHVSIWRGKVRIVFQRKLKFVENYCYYIVKFFFNLFFIFFKFFSEIFFKAILIVFVILNKIYAHFRIES